jgi:ABC-type phosphonate transport system ATPase subunit
MSEPAAVGTLWSPGATVSPPLLEVDGLTVLLDVAGAKRAVLRDVSLTLWPGEAVGLVGESGSGKSMTARAIDDPQDPYTQRLRASVPRPGWKPRHRAPGAGEEPDAS